MSFKDFNDEGPGTFSWDYVLGGIAKGRELGFRILQFNAVVESNVQARGLYEKLGFTQLGTIAGGFRMKDGHYENTCPYYFEL